MFPLFFTSVLLSAGVLQTVIFDDVGHMHRDAKKAGTRFFHYLKKN